MNTHLFWALEAEDLLLSLRQAGGRSLGQAWVPCWLHPGAGEHLVEEGVRWDSTCTLNCYRNLPGQEAGSSQACGGGVVVVVVVMLFAQEHP